MARELESKGRREEAQTVQAPRAAAILYSLLANQGRARPWLLPANICPIVPAVFLKARVPFEFVDISATTLHMDLEQAAARIRPGQCGGVLYAHTYGEASTPNEFFAEVKACDPDLIVVDDRCLCPPDLEPPVSLVADVALYSTGHAKFVELGFGGYAFMQPRMRYVPASLPFSPAHHAELEASYKASIQAHTPFHYRDSDWLETKASGPAWSEYRQELAAGLAHSAAQRKVLCAIYTQELPAELQLPAAYQTWRFNLRVREQRRVLDAIFAAKLFASAHYASLAGIMTTDRCPQAEALARDAVNLFIDHHFTVEQAERVCAIIRATL